MDYKEALKSILSQVCDAKLEQAVRDVFFEEQEFRYKIRFEISKLVLERYLQLVKEELGI